MAVIGRLLAVELLSRVAALLLQVLLVNFILALHGPALVVLFDENAQLLVDGSLDLADLLLDAFDLLFQERIRVRYVSVQSVALRS